MLLFTSQLNNICFIYFQHFKFSMLLSIQFFIASYKAFIHAIFPFLFITSSTDINNIIKNKLLLEVVKITI